MDIAVDIYDQLTTATALATQPPAIVRPYFDSDRNYNDLVEKLKSKYEASREGFSTWISAENKQRNRIIKIFENHSKDINNFIIQSLTHSAIIFEKKAEHNAIELSKYQNKTEKYVKEITSDVGKSEGKKITFIMDAVYAQWAEEIDLYLNTALLFRGLACKYDPDQEVVFTAKSAEDIDEFFKSLN